jgi:hypothetical protein
MYLTTMETLFQYRDYILASDGKLNDELEKTWKEAVVAYVAYKGRNRGKPQKTSVGIAGAPAEIRI